MSIRVIFCERHLMLVTLHRLFALRITLPPLPCNELLALTSGYTTQRNFVCDFVLKVLRGIFQPKRKYEYEKQFT